MPLNVRGGLCEEYAFERFEECHDSSRLLIHIDIDAAWEGYVEEQRRHRTACSETARFELWVRASSAEWSVCSSMGHESACRLVRLGGRFRDRSGMRAGSNKRSRGRFRC